MAVLTPIPRVSTAYNNTIYSGSNTGASITVGSLPPGISLSRTSTTVVLSGTPTTAGAYSFTVRVTRSTAPTIIDLAYTTQVAKKPIPSSGPIKWSFIKDIVGVTGSMSASNNRFKVLANGVVNTSPVKASSTRSKPVAGSKTFTGTEPWTVPVYSTMVIRVKGAGGGGGRGIDVGSVTGSCFSLGGNYDGAAGNQSSLYTYIAYGGAGGQGRTATSGGGAGADGGNTIDATLGGGAAGGAGISGASGFYGPGLQCPIYTGGAGGAGGLIDISTVIGINGIEYLTSVSGTAGTVGSGSNGTPGSTYVEWS